MSYKLQVKIIKESCKFTFEEEINIFLSKIHQNDFVDLKLTSTPSSQIAIIIYKK